MNAQRSASFFFFFFNDTATTEIYTLSLHDALPISYVGAGLRPQQGNRRSFGDRGHPAAHHRPAFGRKSFAVCERRSEEHTSELQSRLHLVCRLLLEKKKHKAPTEIPYIPSCIQHSN